MTILCRHRPMSLRILDYAIFEHQGPVAVRYPKGSGHEFDGSDTPIEFGKGMVLKKVLQLLLLER